jgi:hypothetical protein
MYADVHTGRWYVVCMHTINDLIADIATMDAEGLDRVQAAIDGRRQDLSASSVVERRNHLDGILQLEYRANPKTGKQRGPYWYFKWREDGKQHTLYLGSTDNPEGRLQERRDYAAVDRRT